MADAASFLSELESRNQNSVRQLADGYAAGLAKEGLPVADVLRLELRSVVEAIEVAALWLPDAEPLALKLALATRCGDGARQVEALGARLDAVGVPLASFDPRHGGYSKLFAFFRSLQTPEERTAAGFVTVGNVNVLRMEALAAFSEEKGDPETARLYREILLPDERRHVDEGRRLLLGAAGLEESQARARRAAYRTIELVGELQDVALLKRFLARSLKK